MSHPTSIALVGLPGSGKTRVGAALAERLGWTWTDLDAEIEETASRPVPEIVREDGEPAFRRLELDVLRRVLARGAPAVISCGGGVLTEDEARALLLDRASVVWLDAPDAVLLSRLGDGSGRPLLDGDPAAALPRLRASRTVSYARAHLRVSAADGVHETVSRVAAALCGAVRVPIPSRAYTVEVRPGAIADIELHVPGDAARVAIVAERRLARPVREIASALRRSGRTVSVFGLVGGEGLKTWASAGRLLQRLSRAHLQRADAIVAVGGGTIGDLSGFVAATYLRGIAFLNVPTTLLAMVDSAIGGKTGVNLPQGKNLAGAIWQPRAVVCDTNLLATLSGRDYGSAFAEIVKYCMISEDGLVPLIDQHIDRLRERDPELVAEVVRRCVAIKAGVVSADEREGGLRAILNYGHTVGHAIEAATGFGPVNHGEAIAVGMHVAGRLSVRFAGCPEDDIAWQDQTLQRYGLEVVRPLDPARVLHHIGADKKSTAAGVGWVLLQRR
ncbi:MAG: 3-dehydroquinate synthase, partial [Candidatus Dormibacteraeota bacterium]|nr:3-dehydroquinate synthase [Candidatus Dormibacteraeota bacterium]